MRGEIQSKRGATESHGTSHGGTRSDLWRNDTLMAATTKEETVKVAMLLTPHACLPRCR